MAAPDDPPDEELAERVAELEATLEELRSELRSPPRGPLGLPRPPTPRELLRFADEYAIPTAIAVLEATIRTLELVQGVFRLLAEGDRAAERSRAARDRARDLGRESLARLDDALDELQAALEDADLPENPEARSVLEDARKLNAEVRAALGEPTPGDEVDAGNGDDDGAPGMAEDAVEIDVDAELESIKDELEEDGDANGNGNPNANADTDDGDAGEPDAGDDEEP